MKILISGAGIAGFTLAYWLKRYGFTPTLIENHPFLRKGGYKVDVRGAALEVAKRMGIYEALTEANVNIERSKFVTPDLKVFEFEGDILGRCSEEDIEVNRWDLSQIISKAVGEVEIIFNDSITRLEERVVYFEKGEPREFDLVIGAEGIHSKLRKLVFGEDSKFLKEYGVHFCIFPIPNIFELDRSEIVYFNNGKFASAYAVNNLSLACLAFKSEKDQLFPKNLKSIFEEQFIQLGWEFPRLIQAMNESSECYFDSICQVRLPSWSKGRVALVGDAAYAASVATGMGTSLAMVGAYVLATEIAKADGDYVTAFARYEELSRKFVEKGQAITESNIMLEESTWLLKCQLYVMKILPRIFIRLLSLWGRRKVKQAANAISLDIYQ